MSHKTKATPKDRQWLRTKQAQDNRNHTTTPALNVCLTGGGAYSCSLGLPSRLPLRLLHRDSKYSSRANEIGLASGLFGGFLPGSFLVMGYAFGSMPSLRSFSLHDSFTQALKFPFPAMDSICSSNGSSKRIIFLVLPERSCFDFSHSSCMVHTAMLVYCLWYAPY